MTGTDIKPFKYFTLVKLPNRRKQNYKFILSDGQQWSPVSCCIKQTHLFHSHHSQLLTLLIHNVRETSNFYLETYD